MAMRIRLNLLSHIFVDSFIDPKSDHCLTLPLTKNSEMFWRLDKCDSDYGKGTWKNRCFFRALPEGGAPFSPFAFLVNNTSLFLQKYQCFDLELFVRSLGKSLFLSHPEHLFVVSALKCLLISVLPKFGGGLGERSGLGNTQKKNFSISGTLPQVIFFGLFPIHWRNLFAFKMAVLRGGGLKMD